MAVRKKRPRGVKREAQGVQVSPLSPRVCCSLARALPGEEQVRLAQQHFRRVRAAEDQEAGAPVQVA